MIQLIPIYNTCMNGLFINQSDLVLEFVSLVTTGDNSLDCKIISK